MKQNYDAEFFERLSLGKVEESDLQLFRQKMSEDENIKKNAEAYSKLFEGFGHLKAIQFQKNVEEWESDCQKNIDSETELLEAFVSNKLTHQENVFVKKRAASDPLFSAKLQDQKKLHQGFEQLHVENMVSEVMKWESEIDDAAKEIHPQKKIPTEAKKRTLIPRRYRIGIAAALIPLIIGGQFVLNSQYGNGALLNNSYQLPLTSTLRSAGQTDSPALDQSLTAMKAGDLSNAESILNDALNRDNKNTDAQIMKVHLLMQQKKYAQAESLLSQIETDDSNLSQEKAWMKALISLGLKSNVKATKALLLEVANDSDNPHELEAKALLKKVNSNWRKLLLKF